MAPLETRMDMAPSDGSSKKQNVCKLAPLTRGAEVRALFLAELKGEVEQ